MGRACIRIHKPIGEYTNTFIDSGEISTIWTTQTTCIDLGEMTTVWTTRTEISVLLTKKGSAQNQQIHV